MVAYTYEGLPTSGTTAQRPTNAQPGFHYYDSTLNQMIFWTGTQWVTSGGNTPAAPATVAAAGNSQGTAAAVGTGFTLVTGADGTVGVILPSAQAGLVCTIKNNASATLKVYPNTADAINALTANAAYSMATNLSAQQFYAYDATTWYTVPYAAS